MIPFAQRSVLFALLGVLGQGLALGQEELPEAEQKGPELEACIKLVGRATGLRRAEVDPRGGHYVLNSNGHFSRYNEQGQQVVDSDLEQIPGMPEFFSARDFAVTARGDVLLLGLSRVKGQLKTSIFKLPAPPLSVLLKGKAKPERFSRAELVSHYPTLEASRIQTAPDGRIFLQASRADKYNAVVDDQLRLSDGYADLLIHELDESGNILRSLFPFFTKADSIRELTDQLDRARARELIFSPGGTAYLRRFEELEVERLDLETGRITNTVSVEEEAPIGQYSIPSFQFLNETEALYAILDVDQGAIRRSRIRTLNIETGFCTTLAESWEGLPIASLYNPHSGQVSLVTSVFPVGGLRVRVPKEEFLRIGNAVLNLDLEKVERRK